MNTPPAGAQLAEWTGGVGLAGTRFIRRHGTVDWLLALLGGAAILAEAVVRAPPGITPIAYALILLAAVPLAFRRVAPLRALICAELGAVLCAWVLDASWSVTAVVGVALYTVAVLGDRQRSLVVGAVTSVAVAAAVVLIDGTVDAGGLFARVLIVVICVAVGDTVRSRRELRVAARERAERDAREREEALRQRAAAERMQVARELHDTLGHFLVAINVRASVAVEVPETQDATVALRDIKQVSATALRDLRSTLSVLRDQNERAPTTPPVGLELLPSLVDRARSAGIDTELDLDTGEVLVPAAISAAAVRIVQESLTNVLRHAGAAHAHVTVQARDGALRVAVADDGAAQSQPNAPGSGVQGMAERAAALGGRLEAGPQASGGWLVQASLPLEGGFAR